MAKVKELETVEHLLTRISTLEGIVFAGQIGNHFGGLINAECSCQNCGCDSRSGETCGCNPLCSCQGHTASMLEQAVNVMLGAANHMPLDEFKSLLDIKAAIEKKRKA